MAPEPTLSDDTNLILMVGEIRSDVKKLLDTSEGFDTRINKLEHRQWWLSGVYATLVFFAYKIGLGHLMPNV